ncbi:MAG: hypothetical protein HY677_02840 [Chloroflexi bacterium]|nr:hypothetical protein [Chloroflexota bacterium]
MESLPITPEDDALHPPTLDDMWWCETHWFNFDQPGPNLSTTIYPFIRKNMNIASVAVFLWDGSACEPWHVRYGRAFWQVPISPSTDFKNLRLEGLEYDRLEPFKSYRVAYKEGDIVDMELHFEALREPHLAHKSEHGGHLDQTCRVRGFVKLDNERIDIDCFGMRDKSWGPRTDRASGRGGGAYTFGISGDDQFLVLTGPTGRNVGQSRGGGFFWRDGKKADISRAERRVIRRRRGYPEDIELQFEDSLGRQLRATGRCLNRVANQALAGTFAWLSMTEWRATDGALLIGEDQEVWTPDMLRGGSLLRLDTD